MKEKLLNFHLFFSSGRMKMTMRKQKKAKKINRKIMMLKIKEQQWEVEDGETSLCGITRVSYSFYSLSYSPTRKAKRNADDWK
jgi:hypothetical protein